MGPGRTSDGPAAPETASPPDAPADPAAAGTGRGQAPGPAGGAPHRPRPDLGRALRRVGLAVLVGLLLAEVGTRLIADHLPAPGDDGRAEVLRKEDDLEALAADGGPDVVFFGNSLIDAGVDPVRFSEASTRFAGPAYNAALLGAPIYLQTEWIEEVTGGPASPAVSVVGLGPLDVIDWANPVAQGAEPLTPAQQRLFESLVTDNIRVVEDDLLSRAERRASDASALVEHRGALRDPGVVLAAAFQTAAGRPPGAEATRTDDLWDENLGPGGNVLQFQDRQGGQLEGFGDSFLERSLLTASRPERVEQVVDLVEEGDSQVVLLVPPVDLPSLPPATAQAYVELADEIVAEGERLGVTVVDRSRAGYPAELYADGIHLNAAGTERLSVELAAALDAACAPAGALACGAAPAPEDGS